MKRGVRRGPPWSRRLLQGSALRGSRRKYAPTFGIRPGDPVTFKVRSFGTTVGSETWDFGDGSPPVTVKSDGNVKVHAPDGYAVTVHRYRQPGHYVAAVRRSNQHGFEALGHVDVRVEPRN